MNKLGLVIEHSAEIDINQIADYIAEDNKKAALKTVKEIYKGFRLLCLHPMSVLSGRSLPIEKLNFILLKNTI